MTFDPIAVVRDESDRFASTLAATAPTTPVPSCPGWDADDLLWHLTEVHDFWARVIGGRVTEVEDEEAFAAQGPARPAERDQVLALRAQATEALLQALASRSPDEPAWSWFPADQTVDFTRRMQTHEATIHRVDAELTAGVPVSPIDPEVAAAGITHAIEVMRGVPDWAELVPVCTATLRASDTTQEWLVEVGRWTGVGPQSGRQFDEPYLRRAPRSAPQDSPGNLPAHDTPRARAVGPVDQLDLWLWGRPATGIELSGDPDAVEALRAGADVPLE